MQWSASTRQIHIDTRGHRRQRYTPAGMQVQADPHRSSRIADVRYRDRWCNRAVPEGGARTDLHICMGLHPPLGMGCRGGEGPEGVDFDHIRSEVQFYGGRPCKHAPDGSDVLSSIRTRLNPQSI